MLDDLHEQVGQYFDDREDAFDPYNAVIGAAEYSLITTRAVKRVIAALQPWFLSLPLSTSNGQSLLSYDFLNMSLPKSRIMASIIMACYQNASHIHVTTELGTNLDFNIEGRVPASSTAAATTARAFPLPAWKCMWHRWRATPTAP